MEFVGSILGVIKFLGAPTCRCIDHHRKLEENVHDLRRRMNELNIIKQDTELRKEAEIRCRKVVKREVEKWLEDVDRMNIEIQNIEHKFHVVSCFSRASLGKLVCKKIEEIERIYQHGSFPEGVAVEGPPTIGLTLPTPNIEGEIDVKEKIWKYLMGDEFGIIGVCGMGGIGKTTILKHINNMLVNGNQFDQVIWVTVSKEWSIFKLQQDISHSLKIEHNFSTNEVERAAMLKNTLEGKRYVMILDDVWERISLLELGIIEATLGKERKIILTSRSIEVCKSMGCEVVKVQLLSKQESMNLFLDHVGVSVQQNQDLEDIVDKIVEQCGGLPLAITTIGSSMKGEDDICEWRNALKELKDRVRSVKGADIKIFEQLKFSYDRLKDYPNIQNCFLYCSFYPEDYEIGKVDLIESWIDEGLLADLETRQAMHDRGHSILNKLENNCLLERAGTKSFEKVKMHDVLRDMALTIKSSGDQVMVKAGANLKELPGEHEWKMCLRKVSLMENSRLEIPPQISPRCINLTTLLMQGCRCYLTCFSESFFLHMSALKVLNVSFTGITHLPNSISVLKNLNALILVGCEQLRFVPSLAELRSLRKVDLLGSNIEEVPQGIEMLDKLTYLSLGLRHLKELPLGIISTRISNLQCLIAKGMHLRGEEVGKLRKLEILKCNFVDLQEYKKYARLMQGKFPSNFSICVQSTILESTLVESTLDRHLKIEEIFSFKELHKQLRFSGWKMEKIEDMIVPNDLHSLDIDACDDLKCLSKNPLFHKARKLKVCRVSRCAGMECVIDSSLSSSSYNRPQGIEVLHVSYLINLLELVRTTVESTSPTPFGDAINIFSSLRDFRFNHCPRVETLFPGELLQGLQNLERIGVFNCEKMEKIFGEENIQKGDEGTKFILPKLKALSLSKLPQLKSICSVRTMIPADNLQCLIIRNCKQLKRIPLYLPRSENGKPSPPPLTNFKVWPMEWWESVELDDPSSSSAKDVLSRYLYL